MTMTNEESEWSFALQVVIGLLMAFILWTYTGYIPLQKHEARDAALAEVSDHLSQMESLRRAGGPDAETEYKFTERELSDLLGKDMGDWLPMSGSTEGYILK